MAPFFSFLPTNKRLYLFFNFLVIYLHLSVLFFSSNSVAYSTKMCKTETTSTDRDILPEGLKPVHYDLKITDVDVEKLSFTGFVEIEYKSVKDVTAVYVNSKDLEIKKASAKIGSNTIAVKNISYDEETQVSKLELESELKQTDDKVLVSIDYTGLIQTDMSGFYKSKYKDNEGNDAVMLSTQFESTDARKAFPCGDEPNLKATFDVSITISQSNWTVLGNMPVVSQTTENGITTVKFERTPIMSTYLLAWAIGEFEYVEGFTDREYNGKQIPVRVYTTKGLSKQGKLALDTATKVIDYFSDIFEIDYALPKCDLLAVPEFSAGAMENWGLITYRTTALLFDEETSDSSYRVWVLEVVAHELAHQWFGNLVTMSWWNELWLNEGYATYASWLAVDHLHPEWDVFSKFVTDSLQGALGLDSLRTSHPIDVPVKSAMDVDQIFDNISYLKGASVIRMISTQLGDDVFIKGVSNYLKKHSYGNATTIDLWNALSDASGVDLNSAIGTWTLKIGFPVITVNENENGDVTLRQDRFLGSGDVKEAENQTVWWVPLKISSGPESANLLENVPTILNDRELTIPGLAKNDFFLINKDVTGVYRVRYTTERLEKISQNMSKLSLSDKIGVLADVAACATAGLSKTDSVLSVMLGMKKESSYNLWSEILFQLNSYGSNLFEQSQEIKEGYKAFARDLISYNLEKLGYEFKDDEDYLTTELRSSLFATAVSNNVPEAVKYATDKFFAWKNGDKNAIHPSIRDVAFRAAISNSTGEQLEEVFETILNELKNPSTVDSAEISIRAIGRSKDMTYINRALDLFFSGLIPAQDLSSLLSSVSINPYGRWRVYEFVKENWAEIYKKYGSNYSTFSYMLRAVLVRFSSHSAYDDVTQFFADKDTKSFDRVVEQSLDVIKTQAQWVDRDAGVIESWLKDHKYM